MDQGVIRSEAQGLAKVGDNESVLDNYDPEEFYARSKARIQACDNQYAWVGTHHWPGLLDLTRYDRVILVTTETVKSRLYRWARARKSYYLQSSDWINDPSEVKQRATAKQYLKSFKSVLAPNTVNIEFSTIVDQRSVFLDQLRGLGATDYQRHLDRWMANNDLTLDTTSVGIYYDAEWETVTGKHL